MQNAALLKSLVFIERDKCAELDGLDVEKLLILRPGAWIVEIKNVLKRSKSAALKMHLIIGAKGS